MNNIEFESLELEKLKSELHSIKDNVAMALLKTQKCMEEFNYTQSFYLFEDYNNLKFNLLMVNMEVDKLNKKLRGERNE